MMNVLIFFLINRLVICYVECKDMLKNFHWCLLKPKILNCLVLWKENRKYSHLMSFNLGILFCFIKLIAQNNQTVIKIVHSLLQS